MGYIPRNLNKDDIVLAGVSRTGKTSLSTYLPQEGYKVPNVRTRGVGICSQDLRTESFLASNWCDRKAVEETSAVILRLYLDRRQNCSTPRITRAINRKHSHTCPTTDLKSILVIGSHEKAFFNAVVLTNDKESEAKSVGFSNYSEMDCVREELEFALRIFAQNPFWPVIGNVVQFSNVQLIGSFKDMLVIDS
ncbi:hypothetical protein OIU77_009579 [Salix suchowensis]|uniref:Uncharacterized protein n=1 Tax=Salix suchowensis TaxID=1278906 RepID=A0ABQ9AH18_9ROSI|nr:hypothetical protein OIU77_009579 [Salix suchowensis]